jgi:hypothetical protein
MSADGKPFTALAWWNIFVAQRPMERFKMNWTAFGPLLEEV